MPISMYAYLACMHPGFNGFSHGKPIHPLVVNFAYGGLAYSLLAEVVREASYTTLIMQLRPVFHCSSLNTLDPGSGQ